MRYGGVDSAYGRVGVAGAKRGKGSLPRAEAPAWTGAHEEKLPEHAGGKRSIVTCNSWLMSGRLCLLLALPTVLAGCCVI
jgi:hypothetical protein